MNAFEIFAQVNNGNMHAKYVDNIIKEFEKVVRSPAYTGGGIIIKSQHPQKMSSDIIGELRRIINNEKLDVVYISASEIPWMFTNGVYDGKFTPIVFMESNQSASYLWFHMEE